MNPSTASLTPAATNVQKAATGCGAMISHTISGTSRSLPIVIRLGIVTGIAPLHAPAASPAGRYRR